MANTFKFGNGEWAVGKETALAYNDENSNFKPLPFTFDRASTATVVNKQGLIETVRTDEPRIDFLNNTKGALLLEPSRTNNLNYSEQFDNSYWINNGVTITSNEIISPSGALNADLLTGVSGGFGVVVFSTWSSTNKVASCFAKKGSSDIFKIANASSGVGGAAFDLEDGVVTSVDSGFEAQIQDYGNGWYRCITIDTLGRSGTFSLGVTSATESVYLWGAQLEAGSYATSYIPTEVSSVTRVAEVANGAGNSTVFNDSEGVLYAEIAALADDGTSRRLSISDGSNNNQVSLIYGASNQISPAIYSGGSFQMGGNYTLSDQTDTIKVALKYNTNDAALWVNGFEVITDTSITTPTGLNQTRFEYGNGSNDFYGKVKDLKVYNTALTDTELQNLTS